jgi:hypothetical protein
MNDERGDNSARQPHLDKVSLDKPVPPHYLALIPPWYLRYTSVVPP